MDAARLVREWLATLPSEEGVAHISSARRYVHEESAYDEKYGSDPANLTVGRGVVALLGEHGADFSAPALEVGCGTGQVSLGLVERGAFPLVLLTDPSPEFLRLARRKLRAQGLDESRVRWGVLRAEEIDRLPAASFSLIVLRSTLHHVLEVPRFLADAARALRPGGVLTFQEPCQEGYVLMGALAQVLPLAAAASGRPLTPAQAATVGRFVRAMQFYARRDVDKSQAEDKHLFRVDELMRWGDAAGLRVEFHANVAYEHFAHESGSRPPPDTFTSFFRLYARYCTSWGEDLMRRFDECLAPLGAFVDAIGGPGGPPYLHGVFVCRRS